MTMDDQPQADDGIRSAGTPAKQEATTDQPESVAELRADRDEARQRLGDAVEQLAGKADVNSRAKQAAGRATSRARGLGTTSVTLIRGHAGGVGAAIGGAAVVAGGAVLASRRMARRRARAHRRWWKR